MLAAAGEPEGEAVAALVDYVDGFGDRYCPKALEQVLDQAPLAVPDSVAAVLEAFELVGDQLFAEELTPVREVPAPPPSPEARVEFEAEQRRQSLLAAFDVAVLELVREDFLSVDIMVREILGFAPPVFVDVVAVRDALEEAVEVSREFLDLTRPAAEAAVVGEERAAESLDVLAGALQASVFALAVPLEAPAVEADVTGFESDAPVEGFHCIEIAPGGFEVIEEEFFPSEFPPAPALLGLLPGAAGAVEVAPREIPPDAIWRLQAAGVTGLFIAADYPSRALALAAVPTVPVGWPWFVSWFVLVRDPVSLDLRASALTTTDSGVR